MWIESHQELGRHPKLLRLARQLAIPQAQAVGHLMYLWWWALDYAQDGNLAGLDAAELAAAANWPNDPALFRDALIAARFLDQTDDSLTIHDWDEYAGKLIRQRAAHSQRMKTTRAAHVPSTLPSRAAHVRARSPLQNSTEQNSTEQNIIGEASPQKPQTSEEQEEDQSLWPEWFSLGWGLPGWKAPYAVASEWKEANGITDELALAKVYALRDWWPRQPAARQRGDAYATWQHWCQRDKTLNGANANGHSSQLIPPNEGANEQPVNKFVAEKARLDQRKAAAAAARLKLPDLPQNPAALSAIGAGATHGDGRSQTRPDGGQSGI